MAPFLHDELDAIKLSNEMLRTGVVGQGSAGWVAEEFGESCEEVDGD